MTLTIVSIKEITPTNTREYSEEELHSAFDRVKNKEHWKLPIRCTIDYKDEDDIDLIRESVIYFTGSVPDIDVRELKNGKKRVKVSAVGYYIAIGA